MFSYLLLTCWIKTINVELQALQNNFTWNGVCCSPNVKLIGCKWVYFIKLNSNGFLNRYKARLDTLRHMQKYGIDYDETFAPVVKMTIIHTTVSIAASSGGLFIKCM